MTMEEAKQCARKKLSAKRYRHTKNVAAGARRLALRWGADPDKAELAGWLHDIVKEEHRDELLQLLKQDAIMAGSTEERPLPVWHGPCAAIYAKHQLGVDDEGVLGAIACHTTGKPKMTVLDKALFLADAISDERNYEGVEELRALSQKDLNAAVMAAMEENLRYLQAKGKVLDSDTIEALAYLKGTRPDLEAKT